MEERSRVALVVGSRYGAPGQSELTFADDAAVRLATVLAAPSNGWVISGGQALLNPTVKELKAAAENAIQEASSARAQLLFSFVGHGLSTAASEVAASGYPEFYLQLRDSHIDPMPDEDFNVGSFLHSRLRKFGGDVDGVILVIDACQAGALPAEAIANWRTVTSGRLEVLVASEHDRNAYAGCFTATLIENLENGLRECGDYLHPTNLVSPINRACTSQRAIHSSFNYGNYNAKGQFDEGLTFGVNPQRDPHALFNRPDSGVIDQVTRDVVPSEAERLLVVEVDDASANRLRWITGPAGAGKSTVAAGLIRPRSLDPSVHDSKVKAAAFLDATTTVDALSRELAQQLTFTLKEPFGALHATSIADATERPGQSSLETELLVPLRDWPDRIAPIEVVLDGFDQVDPRHAPGITGLVQALAADPNLPRVRLIVTSRYPAPDGVQPGIALTLAGPTWAQVRTRVANEKVQAVLPATDDPAPAGWLLGRLAAALTTPPRDPSFGSIVTSYLQQILEPLPEETQDLAHLVLSLLTVTGTGPVLPLTVLQEALASLDRPIDIAELRNVLVALFPLIQRGKPGFPDEHVGLAHEEIKSVLALTLLDQE